MGKKRSIEIWHECKPCEGTGLYMGMAERNGDAVVCSVCRGTGKALFKMEYSEFTGRKKHTRALRVLQTNPGIVNAPGIVSGGVSVDEWERDPSSPGKPGAEMREHTCPAWWYQSADYSKKPNWNECRVGLFSSCAHFANKSACWDRWDQENVAK